MFTFEELIYLIPFYAIGACLGYFSFRYQYGKTKWETIGSCALTTGVGIFLALIFVGYLEEKQTFTRHTNMLIGGLGSFGFPDLVLRYWKKFTYIGLHLAMKYLNRYLRKEADK